MSKTKLILIYTVALLVGIGLGWFSLKSGKSSSSSVKVENKVHLEAGTLYPIPKPISPFRLTDHNSNPFSIESIRYQWTLIYMGYTFCPDICPTTLVLLDEALGLLETSPNGKVKVILLSADPRRDTPPQLKTYLNFFNSDFVGVTGSDEDTQKIAKQLRMIYLPVTDEQAQADNYLVDHSSTVVLINPKAEIHAVFSPPLTPKLLAADLKTIISAY